MPSQTIYSVSQVNRGSKLLLEEHYSQIWVTGELSNLAKPSSGHLYFTLKDAQAQVRCAYFKNSQRASSRDIQDGVSVLVCASVSLYEGRGDYQLIIHSLEIAGDGKLQQEFEQRKRLLEKRGWFDPDIKKALPPYPNTVGIITSPSGAAIHDILTTLKRRYPGLSVIIYPTEVQGNQAAAMIAGQIRLANQRRESDILIVTRGGGSIEDLWAFNEEVVAEAIHDSELPVISAIGHEIDFTIADFVADVRAPTPTAAAEIATMHAIEISQRIHVMRDKLIQLITHILRYHQQNLAHEMARLRSPTERIQEQMQKCDEIEQRLHRAIQHHLMLIKANFQQRVSSLNQLNPLAVLERGYACVSRETEIITHARSLACHDTIQVRFNDGTAHCHVNAIQVKSK